MQTYMLQQMHQQMMMQQQMIQQMQQQILLQQQQYAVASQGGMGINASTIGGAPGLGLNMNAQAQLGGGMQGAAGINPLLMGGFGLGGVNSGFPYSAPSAQPHMGAHPSAAATNNPYMFVPL